MLALAKTMPIANAAERLGEHDTRAMRLEEIREFLHGRRVLAVGDVDHLAPRHVNEQADVVVAAPRRSLVGGDAPHPRQIQLLHRPIRETCIPSLECP